MENCWRKGLIGVNVCWGEQPREKMGSWDLWPEGGAWWLYSLEQGRFQLTLIPVSLSLMPVWWSTEEWLVVSNPPDFDEP